MKLSPLLKVFLGAFVFYSLSAGKTLFEQTDDHQYVLLAYSYLHGQLNLIRLPQSLYDLTVFQGKWYIPGGPAPAFLMLPFVALFGISFSDIFFSVLLASTNVLLVYDLLGKLNFNQGNTISKVVRMWLTFFFAAGSPHWYVGALGSVTYSAQITAVTFMLLYVREIFIDVTCWKSGMWLGIAFLARPTTIFGLTFFLSLAIFQPGTWKLRIQKMFPALSMLGLFVGLALIHNYLRFHNPLDFGYEYVKARTNLAQAFREYGGFSPVFIPCNLYISTLALPFGVELFPGLINYLCTHLVSNKIPGAFQLEILGASMFLTMPPLFYAFRADWRNRTVRAALTGSFSIFIPLLMYHNTGAAQFGYRYGLDMIVFLMILIASGIGNMTLGKKLIISISFIINLTGFLTMFYYQHNYEWYLTWLL